MDEITDFVSGTDKLVLSKAAFTGLAALTGANDLSAEYHAGTTAASATDHIIYDSNTGNLYYDADGSGAAAQELIAYLSNKPITLVGTDFAVIA